MSCHENGSAVPRTAHGRGMLRTLRRNQVVTDLSIASGFLLLPFDG